MCQSEYKWGNLQDSFVEMIICQCQVCIVSASFQKKVIVRLLADAVLVLQKRKHGTACSCEILL